MKPAIGENIRLLRNSKLSLFGIVTYQMICEAFAILYAGELGRSYA